MIVFNEIDYKHLSSKKPENKMWIQSWYWSYQLWYCRYQFFNSKFLIFISKKCNLINNLFNLNLAARIPVIFKNKAQNILKRFFQTLVKEK